MASNTGMLLATCFLAVAGAQEQSKQHLTARELFYSGAQAQALPAKSAAPAKSQVKSAPPPARATKQSVKENVSTSPKPAAESAGSSGGPAPSPAAGQHGAQLPGGARIVEATATSGPPLGLKYAVLKYSGGQTTAVPADTSFHAGDRIQLNVETNVAGYLYIINRGSSGMWKPLFPSPEIEDGNNRIEGFHSYVVPSKSRFVFDEQAGNEKLFIVFSREPEPNLEKMIYSLQGVPPAAAPSKEQPAPGKSLLAQVNRIDDDAVGRLRTVYSRDLVIEKVDEKTPETPGAKKETAVYVVNPSAGSDSRVVADLDLVHR